MYRISPLINTQSLKLIYFSLIHSYINYGNIAWASTQPAKLKRILSVQKHACRIIFGKNKFEHAKPLMREMKMMNVYEINTFQHIIFFFLTFNIYFAVYKQTKKLQMSFLSINKILLKTDRGSKKIWAMQYHLNLFIEPLSIIK